ncbi:MAG TPA: hypothetical protein VJ919_11885 [Tangfeifania sp.]|nr:hypothetical protein [Tangfeifania sp.]
MIESLITSKTRIKLLLKFFFNSQNKDYLRSLEKEFGESSNAIRIELNRFEAAGMLKSEYAGNRKYFQANTEHPLFNDINSILKKFIGIDKIIDQVTSQIGELDAAYITGDFAKGHDSQIIDLVLVGKNPDENYIRNLITKAQAIIDRRIRYLVLNAEEMHKIFDQKPVLLIWKKDEK